MAAPAPNPRASLLAGLRTGGVRSTSSSIPHTAAPGGSFNINPPHFVSNSQYSNFPEEEDADVIGDIPPYNHQVFTGGFNGQTPMTAAVDGPNSRFSQHQQMSGSRGMNPHSAPFNPVNLNMQAPSPYVQSQALQMQLMQLEIMRLQTIQAQQYQSELLAQAQRQQQPRDRRVSVQFNPPATAGPLTSAFDLRAATLSAQARRASQADQLRSQLSIPGDDPIPMTAGLGGKFGSRVPSLTVNGSRFGAENDDDMMAQNPPATPSQSTTVISGGTSLGSPSSNNIHGNGSSNGTSSNGNTTPSKSDSAVSWRRGGNNNSVSSGNRSSSPSVRVTPPPCERVSPPLTTTVTKSRPQPLRFSIAASQPLTEAVAIETDAANTADASDDASSTGSSIRSGGSASSPTTPHSPSSNEMPLSPREEAAKKLYEGLGIGRPVPVATSVVSHRMASQPLRQPRGPPSGTDELGPKNFATRIRRKAIGGLGALMAGRERRELVDAF